jgi:dipeptidyl aminopeptidase/acylaminoacyl peptidase
MANARHGIWQRFQRHARELFSKGSVTGAWPWRQHEAMGRFLGDGMSFTVKTGALALGASIWAAALPAHAAEPSLNDKVRDIRDIREIALSPDGAQVAATLGASTAEGGQTHIWLLSSDGKTSRQVTRSGADTESGERAPAWSSDGSALYFRAKRGKIDHLHRLPMSGGEAQTLIIARPATGAIASGWNLVVEDAVEVQAGRYEVSPDGRWIALVAEDGETTARATQVKKKDDGVRVGRDDVQKSRLYLVDAATGQAREVPLPDNVQAVRWSPVSDELVAVTAPANDDLAPGDRIWRVGAADLVATELKGLPRTLRAPDWVPGGLIYLSQCQDDAPPGCADLYVYDFAKAAARNLTRGLKGALVDNLVVEVDGKSVLTPIQVGFKQRLAHIRLADGAITWVDTPQPVVGYVATNARRSAWAMVAAGPLQPRQAYVLPKLGGAPILLAGPALLPADWPHTPSQLVSWKNGDLTIEGMLYLPKLPPGVRAPLVVNVHGGPAGLFQDRSYNLVNLLVAQGWAVLQPNPRGSLGYGAAFEAANKNDMGGEDYRDIMAGVDAVLAGYPLDPDRMALVGYSYGGEMAGFVEGRTNRFKALVSGAPVIDQFSEYGTEDGSFYDRWYYGKPWEHFADAWRQSPLARVGEARTPMLLLQGEDDPTDPLGQSQEMRRAMEQVGAPVVLVTYPRETHATLGRSYSAEPSREPWHGVDLRRRMIAFLADAFAGKPPAAP